MGHAEEGSWFLYAVQYFLSDGSSELWTIICSTQQLFFFIFNVFWNFQTVFQFSFIDNCELLLTFSSNPGKLQRVVCSALWLNKKNIPALHSEEPLKGFLGSFIPAQILVCLWCPLPLKHENAALKQETQTGMLTGPAPCQTNPLNWNQRSGVLTVTQTIQSPFGNNDAWFTFTQEKDRLRDHITRSWK